MKNRHFTNIPFDADNDPDIIDEESAKSAHSDAENSKSESNNSTDDENNREEAKKVLHAVESIIDSNEKIIATCNKIKSKVLKRENEEDLDDKTLFLKVGKKIIEHYSNYAGLTGGVASLPSMFPGLGSFLALVGTSAADVICMLKFEVEMTLCLCHLAGFNIENERDRQLAFTLASVSSYDVLASDNKALDAASLIGAAFWDYSMRQLGKYLLTIIGRMICINISRTLILKNVMRAVPVIGVFVGTSVNKIMTHRTGVYSLDALWARRPRHQHTSDADTIYEAHFED